MDGAKMSAVDDHAEESTERPPFTFVQSAEIKIVPPWESKWAKLPDSSLRYNQSPNVISSGNNGGEGKLSGMDTTLGTDALLCCNPISLPSDQCHESCDTLNSTGRRNGGMEGDKDETITNGASVETCHLDDKGITTEGIARRADETRMSGHKSEDAEARSTVDHGANNFESSTVPIARGIGSIDAITQNSKGQSNGTSRKPNLAEDARLAKITLPINPIGVIQSNAQFLNKSKHFLNYITEKSTNIMEKALIPQQLAVRYNVVSRGPGNSEPTSRTADDSCTGEPKATRGTTDVISKALTRRLAEKCEVDIDGTTGVVDRDHEIPSIDAGTEERDAKNIDSGKVDCSSDDGTSGESVPRQVVNINGHEIGDNLLRSSEPDASTYSANPERKVDATDVASDVRQSHSPQHPVYRASLKDYGNAKTECIKLTEGAEALERTNQSLLGSSHVDTSAARFEDFEKTIRKLSIDLRESLASQATLTKERADAIKEKEDMVMKYAVSEKRLIDVQRARDLAERKMKEIAKDREAMHEKLMQAQGERGRLCNILDVKCRELGELEREVDRLKENVNLKEVKLKWTQNKLRTEMELQKETQRKLEKAVGQINATKEECDRVRRDAQETLREFQRSQANKALTLDEQLKEQRAKLILERHVTEDKEMSRLQLQKDVQVLENRQRLLIEENNSLSLKIQDSEKHLLSCESNLADVKSLADQRQKENAELRAKLSELEITKVQVQHKQQSIEAHETENERLRQVIVELQSDMDACRQREAHMLDFTQKLTDKNVQLQSEFNAMESTSKRLEAEQVPLCERIDELTVKSKALEAELALERKKRTEECEILAKHLAEQTQLAQALARELEDCRGENAVLKRKYQTTVREMSRELQCCRKKLEATTVFSGDALDISRAESYTSDTAAVGVDIVNGVSPVVNSADGDRTNYPIETVASKRSLVDRIIKLQKVNVKRAEKLDFYEEHTRTLVEELQKKTKIIQNYILRENLDVMGSNDRDRHKAELAKHGGIMASVYNQRVSDEGMTLELSLEINKKLQAVLEDALLKNITLKDNIDTLGEEIARLTMQNQHTRIRSSN